MNVTPSGEIALAMEYLRQSVAASATFQAWAGAINAAAAVSHVHIVALPMPSDLEVGYTLEEMQSYRPYVLIGTENRRGFRMDSDSYDGYRPSGALTLWLEADVSESYASWLADPEVDFLNKLGVMLAEMWLLRNTAGYLQVRNIALSEGPYRSEEDVRPMYGDTMAAELRVEWGATE